MSLIHSSSDQLRVIAYNGNVTASQIDRVQDLTASGTLNRTRIREAGRDGTVDWQKLIPSWRVSLRQLEYGNINTWQQLANTSSKGAAGQSVINIGTDFKTSMIDLVGYSTDDDGTFTGSVWYPKLRLSSWGISIGNPQSIIERTFDFIGEDEYILESNNKYFIYKTFTSSGSGSQNFTIDNPIAAGDPDSSGYYLFRVVRYRGTTTTELTYTTDYTYNASTNVMNIVSASVSDIYKVYYSAASYISGQSIFTNNDSDVGGIEAKKASIFLYSSNYVYRLQSVGIDCNYDRSDVYEVGNGGVVTRAARDKTIRITLGRVLENYTIEQALRGVGSTYGKIDHRKYLDDIYLKVRLYTDDAKSTFALGFRFNNLSPVGVDTSIPLYDYVTRGVTLEGEEGFISSDLNQFDE